ncbi:MAG TPA: TIGR03557 family F420-dependent LLM class oxidoreductase [Acidimicrobiales bacterium]|jgi:G6PDH family F420-dependent oxidoreductase|nr:TIGR03557 family F420-dependent LLM class oxidoreductase [Acidimicrobiales bacterium]
MSHYGYFLSSEELSPGAMIESARYAESVGIDSLFVSDHFHPWLESQGQSPFVWSVLGAIAASTEQRLMTGVTCPIVRIHPAILAQASATTQLIAKGRFRFGVGSGENLNEHILGHRWPPVETRLEMFEEAVEVIRRLWQGGYVTHHGQFYTVENARIFSLPDTPPPMLVSGFGPESTDLAARIGDGYVNTSPEADLLNRYRERGGTGPTVAAMKVCWAPDVGSARKLAHDRWKSSGLPGQLSQELAMPSHFEAGAQLVSEDAVAEAIPCGPDPTRHAEVIDRYIRAGYDEIFIAQVGDDQRGFLDFFTRELLPILPAS